MAKDKGINRWILFLIAVVLFAAAVLMKVFPVLIFIALAPLFRLSATQTDAENFWENADLILFTLGIGFLCEKFFDLAHILTISVMAIIYTLPFIGYVYVKQILGPKTGVFLIVIFWSALEYMVLKISASSELIFLSDLIQMKPEWMRWTSRAGYLGGSVWILTSNLIIEYSFRNEKFRWFFLFLGIAVIAGPIIYGYLGPIQSTDRSTMLSLYNGGTLASKEYSDKGEWLARTFAWVSVLILLIAIVRQKVFAKK
jgi:hypothetical protein